MKVLARRPAGPATAIPLSAVHPSPTRSITPDLGIGSPRFGEVLSGPAFGQLDGAGTIQRKAARAGVGATSDGRALRGAAARGLRTPSTALPHAARIQRAFGDHDISAVRAHLGSDASASARAMGAAAYATGDHVVFDGWPSLHDAAHEAAHVVQQRAGVRLPRGIDTPGDRHEQQAEAVARRVAAGQSASDLLGRAGAPAAAAAPAAPVIQRKVTSFDYKELRYDPPVTDLLDTIDYDYFTQSQKTVQAKVRSMLHDPKSGTTTVPGSVEASIAPNGKKDKTPARKTHKSGVIGKIGVDEFYLRAGGTSEVFEGGHLIPHELWSVNDADADSADDYCNLVPMSRNLNVGTGNTWKQIENAIVDQVKIKGKSIDVEIDVGHTSYEISYDRIAQLFGLNVDATGGYDGTDTVKLYGWLPTSLKPVDVTGKKPKSLGNVFENQLHNTFTPITTGAELVEALKQTPLWDRMASSLQGDVLGL
ncbi:DUF4157 domain-containing protein [Sorangium sp. So ce726]|uniref:eCIS core domain-containing protein n=1 Tax=Sorangium sp. So ce726 TaxID=3133319 RepID=UPI003F63366E